MANIVSLTLGITASMYSNWSPGVLHPHSLQTESTLNNNDYTNFFSTEYTTENNTQNDDNI